MSSVPHPLRSATLARPAGTAVHTDAEDLTWRDLEDRVTRYACALARQGVRPGATVLLEGAPSTAWIVSWHALSWLGATVASAPASATAIERAQCRQIFEPDFIIDAQRASALAPDLTPAPERFWPLEEPRAALLTSGSTGTPRRVELTTLQLLLSAFGSAIRLGHDLGDRWLCCLPFHHVAGLSILLRCTWYGIPLVLHPRFDPARVAQALDGGQATLVSLVPPMLQEVLDARPERPFPRTVRAILLGGAAAPASLLQRCRALDAPIALTWGMTEAASQVATTAPGEIDVAAGCGPPLPFARVDVQIPSTAAEATRGALRVHGPLVDGLHVTGDLGHVDAHGRVHPQGRRDDIIISGGENIDPREIEAVLIALPEIADVAVVGRPDPRWGERPVAWMAPADPDQLTNPPPIDEPSLRAWCAEHLTRFKIPDDFYWTPALPRSPLGKLRRHALRTRLQAP